MCRCLNYIFFKGYFGNVICFVRVEVKVGYIVNNFFLYIVNCICKVVEGFFEMYYSKVIVFV